MNASHHTDEIQEAVRKIVAESLAIDLVKVTTNDSLIESLGAESLDFLDIVFKIERVYGIQITRGELERAARGDMSEEAFAPDGFVSEAGLIRLRELMPEVAHKINAGLRPAQILSLFTVQTFVHLVAGKLEQTKGA